LGESEHFHSTVAAIGYPSYALVETIMGIDRIGRKDPPLSPPGEDVGGDRIGNAGKADKTRRAFEVTSPHAASRAPEASPLETSRTALDRWRAGEIDFNGYLDAKVDEATAHLSTVPPPELDAIRSALRDRISSDHTLVELVRSVTGRVPETPGDE
jgi:hypothetical protein